jgi:putative endonuclease
VFYTYIVASGRNGTLYTGSTDNLAKRIYQHKTRAIPGFTAKYGVDQLVWFEAHETREGAFRRERRIKEWRRGWKLKLIEEQNPDWTDLYDQLNMLISFSNS